MIKLRNIIKDTIISFLGRGLSLVSTILLSFAYGHYLGAFAFGELYFAITFVSLIGILIDGFRNQTIRDVSQKPEDAALYFSNVLLIKLGAWFIIFPVILLISWLLGYSVEVRILIAICGFDLLCNVIVNTFVPIHYALERTIFPVIGNLLERGLASLLGIILLRAGAGVQMMAVVLVGGSLLDAIWVAIWYFRLVGTSFVIDRKLIVKLIRADLLFLFSSILMVGTASIDTVIISLMKNTTIVGLYGAASRLADATNFIPNIVMMMVMYPVISKLATTSDTRLKLAFEKSMNFIFFCAIPITTLLIVAAPNIIVSIYGRGFTGAIPALQAFAPYVFFLYMNYALDAIILSIRKDKFVPISDGIGLAANIVLNLILIPLFQHVGSALAASLTEFLAACLGFFIIPRSLWPVGSLRVALKALIASLLMALVVIALHTFNIFIILSLATLVYLGASLLIGTIPREDYQALYRSIRKKEQQILDQHAADLAENLVPVFDLPTMLMPAYTKRGSLLDIELAITGQLPMVRLPLAPQRTGLATNSLGKVEVPSHASMEAPVPASFADKTHPLTNIEMMTTAMLPAFHPQSPGGEIRTVRSGTATTPPGVMTSVNRIRTDNPDDKEQSEHTGG